MAVGHFSDIFDPGNNVLQLTNDSATRFKNEFAAKVPNVAFSHIPFQDDDMKRLVEMCSLEMFLLQNANANDKVIIIADTGHTQRWFERKADSLLCKGDLAFFCTCLVTLERLASLGTRAHSRYSTKRGRFGNESNLRTFSVRSLKTNI